MITFEYPLGTTVTLYIDALSGDPAAASNLAGSMRRRNGDGSDYLSDAPSIPMVAALRPLAGDVPAGFTLSLNNPVLIAQLDAGFYGAEMTYQMGGETLKTSPALLKLRRAA